jgi:hypothetical protein
MSQAVLRQRLLDSIDGAIASLEAKENVAGDTFEKVDKIYIFRTKKLLKKII